MLIFCLHRSKKFRKSSLVEVLKNIQQKFVNFKGDKKMNTEIIENTSWYATTTKQEILTTQSFFEILNNNRVFWFVFPDKFRAATLASGFVVILWAISC